MSPLTRVVSTRDNKNTGIFIYQAELPLPVFTGIKPAKKNLKDLVTCGLPTHHDYEIQQTSWKGSWLP